MNDHFATAERFLQTEARLLDRHLFATRFRNASPAAVVDTLRGYQNADGGFGHGLEPDLRCPDSLPIYAEIALQALTEAGTADGEMIGRACDFLARIATEADAGGAVPPALPVIESYPRAAHWTAWTFEPGVNPTAGLAGLLHRLEFAHPWRDAADDFCWHAVETGALPDEVHALAEVLVFLAHVPDRERATKHAPAVLEQMTASPMFLTVPETGKYGLTPLTIAPTADAPWRCLFDDDQIDAHLDHLGAAQQPDGGWPVPWEPPGAASLSEWRGIVTLQALRTLTSYDRMSPVP